MSDFLLIVPEGWVSIDLEYLSFQGITADSITGLIQSLNLVSLLQCLTYYGLIEPNKTIIDAKIFNNEFCIVKVV